MITRFYFVFIVTGLLQCATAQNLPGNFTTRKSASGKALKYYEKGLDYGQNGETEKAMKQFDKAISAEDNFVDAYIQKAYLFYDKKDFAQAENLMKKAVAMAPGYKPIVVYRLGLAQLRQRKYEEAAPNFQRYLDAGQKDKRLNAQATRHLANCNFSMKAIKYPVDFKPENLGNAVNTEHSEYLPSFTADGETLIFTRRTGDNEDFFMSKKGENGWDESLPIHAINTTLNEAAQSISADGKFMVFTACNRKDGLGSCDLYFSEVKNGAWTTPANMGEPVNSRYWESQPSLSADGATLYFARNLNPRGENIDIYTAKRKANGSWSKPEALGKPINTELEDESPFIHPDGQTLYFMSKGHPGLGGHDLFLSRREKDMSWSEPVNLGYPINTEASEGALVVSLDGKTAYFASDRGTASVGTETSAFDIGKNIGDTDIYSFTLPEAARPRPVTFVKARVFDAKTKEPLSANIEFLDLASGEEFASKKTESDGEFLVCLPIGKNYALNVFRPEYLFHSENFALAENLTSEEHFILEIGLKRIEKSVAVAPENPAVSPYKEGVAVVLKNVFFDVGSAKLRPESFPELNHLRNLLENNKTLRIQLNGHTDNVGSAESNLSLSENRAKAVFDFLVEKGIAASRLAYKGYGETYPVADNETEQGRQQNRRTEFVVVGN